MLMLSLHLLQVSLVYVNTLMIQQVLAEPEWQGRLTAVDLRALSPLKWQHVNPYGTFTLNMQERLPLEQVPWSPGATLPKFRASLGSGLVGDVLGWADQPSDLLASRFQCIGGDSSKCDRSHLRIGHMGVQQHRTGRTGLQRRRIQNP